MIQAWRVLEHYVRRGTIRYLGISNIHDEAYFQRLYNDSIIKPSIVQNRFHSNRGFDITLRPLFQRHHLVIQRFWVLTGNGDGVKRNFKTVRQKGVTPEQLMLAFVMLMGDTPLVGTHSLQHMMEDIQISHQYRELFTTNSERAEYARSIGIKSQRNLFTVSENINNRNNLKRLSYQLGCKHNVY
jgi:diketogulonate reductase-like aldo/keto reductase